MNKSIALRHRIAAILCAVIGVVVANGYLQWPSETTHRFLLIAAVVVLSLSGTYWFIQPERRLRICGWIAGFAFALAQVMGERISDVKTLANTGMDIVCLFVCAVALAPSAGGVFAWLMNKLADRSPCIGKPRFSSRAVFWGSTGLLFLAWLPMLAAFYPGLFTYDISYQHLMFLTGEYNTHHPLLHTLLVGGFCKLGEVLLGFPVKGLLVFILLQMALMALSMASAVRLLYKHRAPTWICVLILALFAFLPFNSLLVISTTKDTLFGGAMLALVVLVMQLVWEPEVAKRTWWWLLFVTVSASTILFRNNGFICMVAAIAVGTIWLLRHRENAKRLLALSIAGLLVGVGINAGLKAVTHAQSGPVQEMFSVPIQQLARVYAYSQDPAEADIERFLPNAAQYATSIADPVKGTFAGGDDLFAFFKLWLEVGVRHPVVYADAFVAMSKGFYQLDEVPPWGGQYLETKFHTDKANGMIDNPQWPWLREQMTKLYSERGYLDVPLWGAFLSHALWCWIMLWGVMAAIYKRNRAVTAAGMISLLFYATALLGPCVMLRYVYAVMISGPVLWGALMCKPEHALKQQ